MEFMEQMQSFAPIILMVVIFYFMLWRPQKKQQKRRQEMLNSMKTGAKVITIGGIYGTIVELHEDYAMLRIAEKTEVKITRQSIWLFLVCPVRSTWTHFLKKRWRMIRKSMYRDVWTRGIWKAYAFMI